MIDLFKNPFALLGVSVQDNADVIRMAAGRAMTAQGLTEEVVQKAVRQLLDPTARLEAEVSWLLGRSTPRVQQTLEELRAPSDTSGRLALLTRIDGVSRSNLAAHLCSVEGGDVPIVRAMVEAQNDIDGQAVFHLVNGNREVAGFPPVSEAAMGAALESLQLQHCAAVCEAISKRKEHRKFMVRLFADNWAPKGAAHGFLERVVAAYDAWYDAHLAAIEKRLAGHVSDVMADSSNTKATTGIKKCLALWDEYSAPLQHPAIDNSAVTKRAESIHGHVSGLCVFLARERWCYRSALQISESLRYAFPEAARVQLALPECIEDLGPMLRQPPAMGAPQELAQVMMTLQEHPKELAQGLSAGGFRVGDRSPAGTLYGAFTDAMATAHGTPAGEGIWIMLRCQALDLHTRHGLTAGAVALLEGLLSQADDHLMPSEVRRMLESDRVRLQYGAHQREIKGALKRGRFLAAERMVERLLLDPPDEAAHDELVAQRKAIEVGLVKQVPWRRGVFIVLVGLVGLLAGWLFFELGL